MNNNKLSKIYISKKVLWKNRGQESNRELYLASLGGFEPTTRFLERQLLNFRVEMMASQSRPTTSGFVNATVIFAFRLRFTPIFLPSCGLKEQALELSSI